MDRAESWPESLDANAWTGEEALTAGLGSESRRWAARDHFAGLRRGTAAARPLPDPTDWLDDRVGWGLLLPDDPAVNARDRGAAEDAPRSARRLAEFRSPTCRPLVLRFDPAEPHQLSHYVNGRRHRISLAGDGPRGIGDGHLPRYLLIAGSPERIPWEVQFALNSTCFTGRLDLDETGWDNYARAATTAWADSRVDATRPLLWTVEHAPNDITALMRSTVAERVLDEWRGDEQIGFRARALRHEEANCAALATELADCRPGVVVTTSHGLTGPPGRPDLMRSMLGWLVDDQHAVLDPKDLLAAWQPDGVVWYSLACCSAGGSGRDRFAGLIEPADRAFAVVRDVAALGPVSASMPKMLLGAARPARAFIGHVEPTFNWTLRRADTAVVTTQPLVNALYDEFFQRKPSPVGYALREWFQGAVRLRSRWVLEKDTATQVRDLPAAALLATLAGIDRECTVILGDPAVAPAALPPSP